MRAALFTVLCSVGGTLAAPIKSNLGAGCHGPLNPDVGLGFGNEGSTWGNNAGLVSGFDSNLANVGSQGLVGGAPHDC